MMRPNLACDAPPEEIVIRGRAYPAATDYRVWIDVIEDLEQGRFAAAQKRVFGGRLVDEDPEDAAQAIVRFAQGYPDAAQNIGGPRLISLRDDINDIVLAVRNQSGIDISYARKEPFHWWLFLLEVGSLAGDHALLCKAAARAYAGDDPARLRLKRALALPDERGSDEEALQEAEEVFYGC